MNYSHLVCPSLQLFQVFHCLQGYPSQALDYFVYMQSFLSPEYPVLSTHRHTHTHTHTHTPLKDLVPPTHVSWTVEQQL